MLISFQLVINLDDYSLNHLDTPNIKTKASNGHVSIASVVNKSVREQFNPNQIGFEKLFAREFAIKFTFQKRN